VAALGATVRAYERLVREVPAQWLMFEDVWGEGSDAGERLQRVPRAAGIGRG